MENDAGAGDEQQQDSQVNPGTNVEVIEPETKTALAVFDPLLEEQKNLEINISKTVYDLTKSKDRKEAIRVRAAINAIPGKMDVAYKNWNQPRLRAAAAMRLKISEISEAISKIVKPLDDQIALDDARRDKERIEAANKERERVDGIQNRITAILQLPVKLTSSMASADVIGKTIDWLRAQEILEEKFAEFVPQAVAAVASTIESLETLKTAAATREQREKELDEERERMRLQELENTRLREEQAERERLAAIENKRIDDESKKALAEQTERERLEAEEKENKRIKDLADANESNRKQADFLAVQKDIAERGARMRNEVVDAMDDSSEKIAEAIDRVEGLIIDDIPADTEKNDLVWVKADTLTRLRKLHAAALADEERIAADRLPETPAVPGPLVPPEAPVMDDVSGVDGYASNDDADAAIGDANAQAREDRDATVVPPDTEEQPQQRTGGGGFRRREEPAPAAKQQIDEIVRPDDTAILHMVATTFGVSEAIALDWLEDVDMFDLRKHVERSNGQQ